MSLENIESSSDTDSLKPQLSDTETNTEEIFENLSESNPENVIVQEEHVVGGADIETSSKNDFDQKLYDEVLEKLDIKRKEKNQDIQEQSTQENLSDEAASEKLKTPEMPQPESQIKTAIAQDFMKIQKLIQLGIINSNQGQNLKTQVLKKAFDKIVQTEKIKRNSTANLQHVPQNGAIEKQDVFEEFSKNNPEFFTSDGRKEVLDYLKSDDVILGKDELNKISNLIRTVEKTAIDRYLKKVTHEKTLRDANETAKQRLTANAQNSGFSSNLNKTFTREQIGKMSSAEFAKYEPIIMENLKKGLIK